MFSSEYMSANASVFQMMNEDRLLERYDEKAIEVIKAFLAQELESYKNSPFDYNPIHIFTNEKGSVSASRIAEMIISYNNGKTWTVQYSGSFIGLNFCDNEKVLSGEVPWYKSQIQIN